MTSWCNLSFDQLISGFGVVIEDVNTAVGLFDDSYAVVGLRIVDSLFGTNNEIVSFDKGEQDVGLWLVGADWRFCQGGCRECNSQRD